MNIFWYCIGPYYTYINVYQRICDQYDGPWWTIHEIWINCMNHSLQQDCVKAYNMNSFIWNIFFYTMILDLQILLLYMLNILFILIFHLILSPWKLRFWFSIPKWMPQVNIHTHICVYTFNICIQIYIYIYVQRERERRSQDYSLLTKNFDHGQSSLAGSCKIHECIPIWLYFVVRIHKHNLIYSHMLH